LTSNARTPEASPGVGSTVDVSFTDLLANGQAVGRAGGRVVFCFGPLPGERATVRITTVKARYVVAEMVRLLSASAHRVAPFCPVFGACGGCHVQHLSYAAQLAWKRDVVRNAFARIGGLRDVAVRPVVGMPYPRAYRNKMALVVAHRGGRPVLGFYRARSHDLVPISACPVLAPPLSEYVGRLDAAAVDPQTAPALARTYHVVARTARATGQTVVTLTTDDASDEVALAAPALMTRLPGAVGITNAFDLSSRNAILGRKHRVVAGTAEIEERVGGLRFRISAGSFFQVNPAMLERILAFIAPGLQRPQPIADLYCGAGTFALFFASHGCSVYGVEENARAVEEARRNAEINGLADRVRFDAGLVENVVVAGEGFAALREARIAFLDPPRKGADERVLDAIARARVPNVWYLSCDPATLARDSAVLTANGYAVGVVQPFDMFPHTGHIETLATFYRTDDAKAAEIAEAFAGVPPPQWPADDPYAKERPEYPDFVITDD